MTDQYVHINCCKNFPLGNLLDEKYSQRALCLDIQLNIKLFQLTLTSFASAFYMFSHQMVLYLMSHPFLFSGHMPGEAFTCLSEKVEQCEGLRAICKYLLERVRSH